MSLKRWDSSAWVDVAAIKRWDGASWIDLTTFKRWDGSVWQDIPLSGGGGGGGFSVTISNGFPEGVLFDPPPSPLFRTVTSNSTTVTPSGGTGPYTYSWVRISGDSAVEATAPTSATTAFRANVSREGNRIAVFRCTVTDATMATATADASVYLEYTSGA